MMQTSNVLVLTYLLSAVYCELCRENCHIGRVQRLRSADCYKKEITRIPQCLPKNTEVLDLSFNRIREITREDFESYPYLQILYLSDNILTEIDDLALDDQTSLHTLDVSNNVFYKVPKALFSLPVLRKLLLGGIRNKGMVEDIEEAVPITSPMVHLDLSQNKLPRLPNLGELPSLQFYNVSGNKNIKLNTSMFAGLCNLQEFINEDFSAVFEDPCECHILERWLNLRNVKFKSFNCRGKECSDQIRIEDTDVFNSCRRLHETQQQELYKRKLLTNGGISIVVGFLLVMLFFILRRNKRVKQKKKMEKEAQKKLKIEVIDSQGLL